MIKVFFSFFLLRYIEICLNIQQMNGKLNRLHMKMLLSTQASCQPVPIEPSYYCPNVVHLTIAKRLS